MPRKRPYSIPLLRFKIRLYVLSLFEKSNPFINVTDLIDELYSYKYVNENCDYEMLKKQVDLALSRIYKPTFELGDFIAPADKTTDEGIIKILEERPNYYNYKYSSDYRHFFTID